MWLRKVVRRLYIRVSCVLARRGNEDPQLTRVKEVKLGIAEFTPRGNSTQRRLLRVEQVCGLAVLQLRFLFCLAAAAKGSEARSVVIRRCTVVIWTEDVLSFERRECVLLLAATIFSERSEQLQPNRAVTEGGSVRATIDGQLHSCDDRGAVQQTIFSVPFVRERWEHGSHFGLCEDELKLVASGSHLSQSVIVWLGVSSHRGIACAPQWK